MPNTSYRVFGTSETYSQLVTPASGNDAATIATITGGNPLSQTTWVVSDAVGEYLDIGDIEAKGRVGGGAWQPMTITSRDAASGTITLSQSPSSIGYNSFRLYRKTQTEPLVNFVDGARLTESDLDKAYRQGLFAAQEVAEDAEGIGNLSTANLTLNGTTTVTDLNVTGTVTNLTATGDVTVSDKIVHSGDTNTAIRFPANDTISCETGGTERMRLNSSGMLMLNGINEVARFVISQDTQALNMCFLQNTNATFGGNYFSFVNSSGVSTGTINQSGSTTVSYNTSSDYRLKENVSYDFDATTKLKQLKPCQFNWISDEEETVIDGFIAHEVQEVVPQAVVGEKDATHEDGTINPQGIDHSKLVPLLVKTIQELEARIATLEAQ